MSCDFPRTAYPIEGGIAFEKPNGHSGAEIKIPCKMCTGCRLDHRTNWSTRMMCETQMHNESHFVTFTYNPENLPENADLREADMQKFFRRLRKKIKPQKIRYVYSGEYGEQFSRPHFHAIIWGLHVPDLIINDRNDRGEPLSSSQFLDEIWQHGYTSTGAVTPQSCGYVAGYMLKDSQGEYDKRNPYLCIDPITGEMTERKRPYARYSTHPGIGKSWLLKFTNSVFPRDHVRLLDKTVRPTPPYFFDQLKTIDRPLYDRVKLQRDTAIRDPYNEWNNLPARKKVRAICRTAKMNLAKRGSKNKQQNHHFIKGALNG